MNGRQVWWYRSGRSGSGNRHRRGGVVRWSRWGSSRCGLAGRVSRRRECRHYGAARALSSVQAGRPVFRWWCRRKSVRSRPRWGPAAAGWGVDRRSRRGRYV